MAKAKRTPEVIKHNNSLSAEDVKLLKDKGFVLLNIDISTLVGNKLYTGKFTGLEAGKDSNIITLLCDDEPVRIWSTSALDEYFHPANIGEEFAIHYLGKIEISGGAKSFHKYKVYALKNKQGDTPPKLKDLSTEKLKECVEFWEDNGFSEDGKKLHVATKKGTAKKGGGRKASKSGSTK